MAYKYQIDLDLDYDQMSKKLSDAGAKLEGFKKSAGGGIQLDVALDTKSITKLKGQIDNLINQEPVLGVEVALSVNKSQKALFENQINEYLGNIKSGKFEKILQDEADEINKKFNDATFKPGKGNESDRLKYFKNQITDFTKKINTYAQLGAKFEHEEDQAFVYLENIIKANNDLFDTVMKVTDSNKNVFNTTSSKGIYAPKEQLDEWRKALEETAEENGLSIKDIENALEGITPTIQSITKETEEVSQNSTKAMDNMSEGARMTSEDLEKLFDNLQKIIESISEISSKINEIDITKLNESFESLTSNSRLDFDKLTESITNALTSLHELKKEASESNALKENVSNEEVISEDTIKANEAKMASRAKRMAGLFAAIESEGIAEGVEKAVEKTADVIEEKVEDKPKKTTRKRKSKKDTAEESSEINELESQNKEVSKSLEAVGDTAKVTAEEIESTGNAAKVATGEVINYTEILNKLSDTLQEISTSIKFADEPIEDKGIKSIVNAIKKLRDLVNDTNTSLDNMSSSITNSLSNITGTIEKLSDKASEPLKESEEVVESTTNKSINLVDLLNDKFTETIGKLTELINKYEELNKIIAEKPSETNYYGGSTYYEANLTTVEEALKDINTLLVSVLDGVNNFSKSFDDLNKSIRELPINDLNNLNTIFESISKNSANINNKEIEKLKSQLTELKEQIKEYKKVQKEMSSVKSNATTKSTKGKAKVDDNALVSTSVKQQLDSLEELRKAVNSVQDAVEWKSGAFAEEPKYVKEAVDKELDHLETLKKALKDVTDSINKIGKTFSKQPIEVQKAITKIKNHIKVLKERINSLDSNDFNLSNMFKGVTAKKIEDIAGSIKTLLDSFKDVDKESLQLLNDQLDLLSQHSKDLTNLAKILSKSQTQIQQVVSASLPKDTDKDATNNLEELYQRRIKLYKEYAEQQEKILKNRKNIDISSTTRNDNDAALQANVLQINSQLVKVQSQINAQETKFGASIQAHREYEELIRKTNIQLQETERILDDSNNTQRSNRLSNLTKQYSDLYNSINKFTDDKKYSEDIVKNFSPIKTEISNILQDLKTIQIGDGNFDDTIRSYSDRFKALGISVSELKADTQDLGKKLVDVFKVSNLKTKITQFSQKVIGDDYKKNFENLANSIDPSASMTLEAFKKINDQFERFKGEAYDAGKVGIGFFDLIGKRIKLLSAQTIAYFFSLYDVIRYVRTAVDAVKEIDYALVDLRKTTTMSASDLNQFYYDANDVAKQMGITTAQVVDLASSFSRLGYSSKEAATGMAQLAGEFALISPGMDTEVAQTGLVSIQKAFDVADKDLKREILDNINIIGNNFATSNDEIVAGLERSASAMSVANNSLEETIALFASGQEITQDAEKMGTALRTISMRIRGYDEETEELSDDLTMITGKVADLTRTADNPKGVTLFEPGDPNTYRSTYDILRDISKIWDDLTDKNQAKLLELLFGKTRANQGAAILTNFDQAEKAMDTMKDAAGSAAVKCRFHSTVFSTISILSSRHG